MKQEKEKSINLTTKEKIITTKEKIESNVAKINEEPNQNKTNELNKIDNEPKYKKIKLKKEKKKIVKKFITKICDKFKFENKRFNALELVMVMIMSTVFGIFIGEIIFYNKDGNIKVSEGNLSEIESVYKTLITDYYSKITEKDLTEAAIKGMMNLLGDNYSFYMDTKATEEFNEQLEGEFTGLGVEITLKEGELPTIATVFEGSKAEEADLKVGDQFVKVNDVETTGKTLDEIASMIKGGISKEINLVIKREGEEITKKITTGKASIPSVAHEIIENENVKTGYIRLSIFAQNTDEQFNEALKELEEQEINNLIIDVRGNTGGHLDTVTNILELFLDKKQVMYQIKNKNKISKYAAKDDNNREYKIAVLIDEGSASASELLASALLEQKNAEIIGKNTFGKGTVQKTMELESGAMIKYTSETWLTSKGNEIDKKGVAPTIEVELSDEYYRTLSKDDDNQLQKALEVLQNK